MAKKQEEIKNRIPYTKLINKKREMYCVARATEGLTKKKAYIKAYGDSKYVSQLANQLEKEQIIKDRIKELESEVLEDLRPTLSWLYKLRNEALEKLRELQYCGDVKTELQAAIKALQYSQEQIDTLENNYSKELREQTENLDNVLSDEDILNKIKALEDDLFSNYE